MSVSPFRFKDWNIFLNPVGDMVHAVRRQTGSFEPETIKLWSDLCYGTDVSYVADVGAYTGLYAIAAAKMGCQAWAFEPHGGNFERLVTNCRENRTEVHCAPYALGCPKNGHSYSKFGYNRRVPLTSGGGIMSGAHYASPRSHCDYHMVDVYALDTIAPGHGFDLMKIDVEGAELDVLRGATGILRDHQPKIILETLSDEAAKDIDAFLADYGYDAKPLDGSNRFYQPEA